MTSLRESLLRRSDKILKETSERSRRQRERISFMRHNPGRPVPPELQEPKPPLRMPKFNHKMIVDFPVDEGNKDQE